MQFVTKTLLILSLTTGLLMSAGFVVRTNVAYADAKEDICKGIGAVSSSGECKPPSGSPSAQKIINIIINTLSIVVGIISVIMIIIGGFRFVLSGGDSQATSSARSTVIYALVGLVIAFIAQILVRFVLSKLEE